MIEWLDEDAHTPLLLACSLTPQCNALNNNNNHHNNNNNKTNNNNRHGVLSASNTYQAASPQHRINTSNRSSAMKTMIGPNNGKDDLRSAHFAVVDKIVATLIDAGCVVGVVS